MKTSALYLSLFFCLFLFSCEDDDDVIGMEVATPATYAFERNGASTVSFSGQTTRLQMAQAIASEMLDFSTTEARLDAMFANENSPFDDADLNASSKSVRSKVAASRDFFFSDASRAATVKADFDGFIAKQVAILAAGENSPASAGNPGRIADGSSTRYVAGDGVEYNQIFIKGLIGAIFLDQTLNNYLSPAVLDEADNRANNDSGTTAEDKPYTTMEHKWDEAYGYVYGVGADEDDHVLKYIGRVEADADYAGIADRIEDAFKLGRAAIVAGDYELRDEQAAILREELSKVVGIRTVYYLVQGAELLDSPTPAYGSAFHDLSEGLGFLYSTQFTRKNDANEAYVSSADVERMLNEIGFGEERALWEVTPATLRSVANEIATKFNISVEEAGS